MFALQSLCRNHKYINILINVIYLKTISIHLNPDRHFRVLGERRNKLSQISVTYKKKLRYSLKLRSQVYEKNSLRFKSLINENKTEIFPDNNVENLQGKKFDIP